MPLYFATMLDKNLHQNAIGSFVLETLHKIAQVNRLPQTEADLAQCASQLTVWMSPNHRLVDLQPVEADDMLVIGTEQDLKSF